MASGIYRLNFNNEYFYVGQSVDIDQRWRQHMDKFYKGTAAEKMQLAFNAFGDPNGEVLINCHKDYLDIMETYYIHAQKQFPGCLNTSVPALDPSINYENIFNNPQLLQRSASDLMLSLIHI